MSGTSAWWPNTQSGGLHARRGPENAHLADGPYTPVSLGRIRFDSGAYLTKISLTNNGCRVMLFLSMVIEIIQVTKFNRPRGASTSVAIDTASGG